MNCAYHAEAQNVAFCIRCGRALCNECIRNVRGSVYCENCLGEIVNVKPGSITPSKNDALSGPHPGVAFALGLIPGVGAIYNGEFMKAAVHLLIFGVLLSMNSVAHSPLIGMFI